MSELKKLFCKYEREATDDSGVEVLKLFLPIGEGYINYNIVHSLSQSRQCNTWRLSVAYLCDEKLCRIRPLTRAGAEWEMALKLLGRPDFIGGFAHGDEVFDKIEVTVDGQKRDVSTLADITSFNDLIFEVWSRGYDPSAPDIEALLHYKKIIVICEGIRVEQNVEWLNSYELGNSYMAMFPPFKAETDSYYTAFDREPKSIEESVGISGRDNALYLSGKTGVTFCMKVEKYISDTKEGIDFYISDNGGVPYNKMYFVLPHNGRVKKGDVWETVTKYKITNRIPERSIL